MATLPASTTVSPTVSTIYAWWENQSETPRAYLGGSQIGRECERELWYAFRWCSSGGKAFDGRMLRLFNRGHREEPTFIAELRGIGYQVHDVDPGTGQQFRFKALGGHAAGGIDGVALGVIEAPKTWHLLEFKTHNAKSFATVARDGVEKAKPEHWAQMQIYMRWAGLERALYLAVNKDNDELYAERVSADSAAGERLEAKAERVIFAPEPLERISNDPAFYKCKGCAFNAVCHTPKVPAPNCRNCVHATPERDGDGLWTCARFGGDPIPLDMQREGCGEHRLIPALLARWGEVTDASEAENWVEYTAADGFVFRNGAWGAESYTSTELHAGAPALLRHPDFQRLRREHAAVLVVGTLEDAA